MRHSISPYRPFDITQTRTGHECVIAVVGELDLASADQLSREVREARAAGTVQLVLDLRDGRLHRLNGATRPAEPAQ